MAHLVYNDRSVELGSICVLGRHRECDVVILDGKASRQHCRVVREGKAWFVEDLASANGTFVNGHPISTRSALKHGDRIGVCDVRISFVDLGDGQSTHIDVEAWDRKALVGRMLGGNRLLALLGSGTLAAVYQAKQVALDRAVAVKVFHPELLSRNRQLADDVAEHIRRAAGVTDPGIASIHEYGSENALLWYSMELVPGETLEQVLERQGPLNPEMASLLLGKVATALAKAHEQGIVHQGIAPKNIMLTPEGRVKLLELALAPVLQKQQHVFRARRSAHYTAPEQLAGADIGPAADCYSLGCVLFHLLSGAPPYANAVDIAAAHIESPVPRLARVRPDAPPALDRLLVRLLAKNPQERLANALDLARELRGLRTKSEAFIALPSAQDVPPPQVRVKTPRPAIPARSPARGRSNPVRTLVTPLALVVVAVVAWRFLGSPSRPALEPEPAPSQAVVAPLPATVPTLPKAAPEPTPAAPDPARVALSRALDADQAANAYAQAEKRLHGAPLAKDQQQSRLRQLQFAARAWWERSVAQLPQGSDATALRARLDALDALSAQLPRALWADWKGRREDALANLRLHIVAAQHGAMRHLEQHAVEELRSLPSLVQTAMEGCAVVQCWRRLQAATQLASALPWLGDWASTRAAMDQAAPSAQAAGALALWNDPGLARHEQVAAQDPLGQQILGTRRQLWDFSDAGALAQVQITAGDPVLIDDCLGGSDQCEIHIPSTLAPTWTVELCAGLSLDDSGELVLQWKQGPAVQLAVRLAPGGGELLLEGQQAQEKMALPAPGSPLRLVVDYNGSQVQLWLDGKPIGALPGTLAAGLSLQVFMGGTDWRIASLSADGVL